jgi:hypothetical protein
MLHYDLPVAWTCSRRRQPPEVSGQHRLRQPLPALPGGGIATASSSHRSFSACPWWPRINEADVGRPGVERFPGPGSSPASSAVFQPAFHTAIHPSARSHAWLSLVSPGFGEARRPSITAVSSIRLLVVSGPRPTARSTCPSLRSERPAAGAGSQTRTIGEELDVRPLVPRRPRPLGSAAGPACPRGLDPAFASGLILPCFLAWIPAAAGFQWPWPLRAMRHRAALPLTGRRRKLLRHPVRPPMAKCSLPPHAPRGTSPTPTHAPCGRPCPGAPSRSPSCACPPRSAARCLHPHVLDSF